MLHLFCAFSAIILSVSVAVATGNLEPKQVLYRGDSVQSIGLDQALTAIKPGSIVVLGEQHNNGAHQGQHLSLLQGLRNRGLKVSVGMEFVTYPFQSQCDSWSAGEMSDEVFLREIQWGTSPFEYYRAQMAFPRWLEGERLLALNAPKALTRKIARTGVSSLDSQELALLPPNFTLGNELYFERFVNAVGHLPSPDAARNYFAAQSTWDDTMAWKASQFISLHPDQVLVIIVGEFHVQYGGGLPDRLRARGQSDLHLFSQLNLHDLSPEEQQKQISPDPKYGPRADYVWTSSFGE